MNVFVEDWGATYGSPYLVQPDDHGSDQAVLVEDGSELRSHPGRAPRPGEGAIAFVDGVRRGEASLWLDDPATDVGARGVAGGHACGCVLADDATRSEYGESRVNRLAIFGSGLRATLPEVPGGWRWQSASIDDTRADAPLEDLQKRMRIAEADLSETLCGDGYLTIVDGPLYYVRSRDLPVVGYVKTHQKEQPCTSHRSSSGLSTGRSRPPPAVSRSCSRTAPWCSSTTRWSCIKPCRTAPTSPTTASWSRGPATSRAPSSRRGPAPPSSGRRWVWLSRARSPTCSCMPPERHRPDLDLRADQPPGAAR